MRPQLIFSALLIGCSSLVAAFSKGSPICVPDAAKMTAPKTMGVAKELGYTVTAKELAKGYMPGGPAVKVTVGSAKLPFKGILVYAADAKGNHVGSFAKQTNLQYVANCQGDDGTGTLTHMDATDKVQMDLMWTPPKAGTGKIMFMAAFVSGGPKEPTPGFQITQSIPYAELAAAPGTSPTATDSAAPPTSTGTAPSPPAGSTPSPSAGSSPSSPAGSTPSPAATSQSSGGISISQYSSFGALVLANVVAAFILL